MASNEEHTSLHYLGIIYSWVNRHARAWTMRRATVSRSTFSIMTLSIRGL
jgi:hypothetical protein